MYKLPPDDEKTYDLIRSGETIGTFQIESRAQIASILHTKPDRLYDIVVQVALIRPGPIQANFVHPYTAAAARTRAGDVPASRSRADSQAHAGHSDLPGAGDGDRHDARRLHGGAGRRAAADDGQHPKEGEAAIGGARASCATRMVERGVDGGRRDEDLRGSHELRELWISRSRTRGASR